MWDWLAVLFFPPMDGYKVKAVAVLAYKQMRCRAELSWAHVKTTDEAHIGVSHTISPNLFLLVGGWARHLEVRLSWRLSVCLSLIDEMKPEPFIVPHAPCFLQGFVLIG
jgi:hypothetical protein